MPVRELTTVLARIRSILSSPSFEDEEEARLGRLLHTLLLVAVGVILFAGLWAMVSSADLLERGPVYAIVLSAIATCLALLRLKKLWLASHLLLAVSWLAAIVLVIISGGIHSLNLMALFVATLLTGLLLGSRAASRIAAINVLVLLGFAYFEVREVEFPDLMEYSASGLWGALVAYLVFASALLHLSLRSVEEALTRARESESRLQEAQRMAQVGHWHWNLATDEQFWSRELYRILGLNGLKRPATTGDLVLAIHPDERERVQTALAQARVKSRSFSHDFRIVRPDGEQRLVHQEGEVRYDASGRPNLIVGAIQDITEREQAEVALRRSAEETAHGQRLLLALGQAGQAALRARSPEQIYRNVGDEVTALGFHAVILTASPERSHLRVAHMTFAPSVVRAAKRLTGISLEEFRFPIRRGLLFERLVASQQPAYEALGTDYVAEALPSAVRPLAGKLVEMLGINESIGAPIMVRGELHGLFFVIGDGLEEADLAAVHVLANQIGVTLENVGLYQELRQQASRLQTVLDTLPEGILLLDSSHRVCLVNPSGQAMLGVLAGAALGDVINQLGDRSLEALLARPRPGQSWHEVASPEQKHIFELVAQPLEVGAEPEGWVLLLREVTEERSRQRYEQAQAQLATVGQLAAGIAHDFNNIMAIITLYSQLALKTADLSPANRERLAIIQMQADRAATLIAQILDFSRRSLMERKPLQLVPYLKELVRLVKRTLPENIAIRLNVDQGKYIVNADPTRLQQAILNLCVNARDAMPGGGELQMALTQLDLRPGQKPPLPGMEAGRWIELSFTDNGTGIDPQHLSHIFEPFFTTKPAGQATGLGLAQVYGIVKQHNGHINAFSQLGRGTTFTLYLPALVIPDTGPLNGTGIEREIRPGNGEVILLVEDEATTRSAMSQTLEMLGYQVLEAGDGDEALALYGQQGNEVDLILSDLVMPGMGGDALFRTLRRRKSDLKMVITTGYPLEAEVQTLLGQGLKAWIPKPFSTEAISEVLRTALSGD